MAYISMWSVNDLAKVAKGRQQNKLDCIIAVSGNRGNGKSTLAYGLGKKFENFKPKKHIIYSRKESLPFLENNKFGFLMDDEAIRSSYKRNFQDPAQKLLIQMLNMYRDNFNVYVICLPKFYSLDKDLRDLVKIHIHVLERGLGVVHLAREDVLYSDDSWDIKYNQKLEDNWLKIKKKKPNYSPPYHKLTTFAGYIKFPALSDKQQKIYDEIKRTKRTNVYETEIDGKEKPDKAETYDRLLQLIKDGKMTKERLLGHTIASGIKYSTVIAMLRRRLKDSGEEITLNDIFRTTTSPIPVGITSNDSQKKFNYAK